MVDRSTFSLLYEFREISSTGHKLFYFHVRMLQEKLRSSDK